METEEYFCGEDLNGWNTLQPGMISFDINDYIINFDNETTIEKEITNSFVSFIEAFDVSKKLHEKVKKILNIKHSNRTKKQKNFLIFLMNNDNNIVTHKIFISRNDEHVDEPDINGWVDNDENNSKVLEDKFYNGETNIFHVIK